MFHKVNKDNCKGKEGTVYIIKMMLDCGTVVHKIGITSRNIEDRLAEIVISIFKSYRYIPRTTVKRFRKSISYSVIEEQLLTEFSDNKHTFDKHFSGCTEFVCMDEDELLKKYDELLSEN